MVRRRLSFWIFYFDNIAGSRLGGCPAILISVRLNVDQPRAFSVPIESERGSRFLFDAFSLREPVSTSLENALRQSLA
jgi:hypothetical protein